MPKYYGVNFSIQEIEENGRKQRVVIGMTEDEANDRSYREYLEQSIEEKTRKQLKKLPAIKPRNPKKLEALREAMKEMGEYKQRKKAIHENTKRFY